MLRALEKIEVKEGIQVQTLVLPYTWKYNFKLLAVMLDCQWAFEEHIQEVRKEAIKRLFVLHRVATTTWGLETRILSITTHALLESVVNYGLSSYGTQRSPFLAKKTDSIILNKAAREIAGTSTAVRRGMVRILADTKSFMNHYYLKTANMVVRVLRAHGSKAQKKLD